MLGEVSAFRDGSEVDLGPPRQRCVLAALAVDAGRVVPADRLIERVWGAGIPRRGRATLHSHISRLRHTGVEIVLRSGGYVLVVEQVDLHRFRDLCARARGDVREVALLTEAVALWRGEPLTGLSGDWAEAERYRLTQELRVAEHDLVDARLRAGEGEALVAELSARAARYPLDERVAGQYLLALHRAGRSADALAHYRCFRDRLVEDQGTDPGAALRDLHRRILAADSDLSGGGVAEPVVVPRQLPAAPPHFAGRDADLAALTAALDAAEQGRMVVISAVGGAGGIGKTWLAVHWAHRQLDRFPDGQLFVDLRGFSPDDKPMESAVAVRGFLDALGVDPGRIPVDPQAQAALLRSLVAGKRMLIMLDNAADAEQVVPLLPGGDSCAVVVTSRRTLTGLITRHGAQHLPLDTLSEPEARALLTRRLGAARVEAEPDAVAELVELCGGFPLALGIIAGRAHVHPRLPLAELAADLRGTGVEPWSDDDPATDLATVLSWSYRSLTARQQTAFGLLGIAPGPDIGLPAAASLTGLSPADAARVLRELQEASLLGRDADGRYSMHDLIRRYATDTAQQLSDDVREAALRRVVGFYAYTAHTANRHLDPHRPTPRSGPPEPDHPHPIPDLPAALAWFDRERLCLRAAQHTAAAQEWHQTVWQLAWATMTFHLRRGHHRDMLATWQVGLVAAEHLHDPATHALSLRQIGGAYTLLGRHDEAIMHMQQSLALAEQHNDHTNQAHTHRALGRLWERRGDDRRALRHATRALSIYRTLGNPVLHAWALNEVGWSHARLGDHDQGRDDCQAALTLFRLHHDTNGEAATLDSLGYIDHHTGRHEQAIRHYRQALTLYRGLGHAYEVANTLYGLGHPYAAIGRREEAQAVWREALELYRAHQRDEDAAKVERLLDGAR
ncbi:hypothetical protein Lesp02_05840 [Lentzea sp. NBRC 105346]|nr:hypothetical protein Lesp02_05840 [Lentzea sp. NBRC 105346]